MMSKEKGNVVFWRWIAAQSTAQFQRVVQDLKESSVEKAYAKENHRLSRELRWKYILIQYSVITFILGLLFAMASTGSSFIVK